MLTRRAALAAVYGAARVRCLAQGNFKTVEVLARLNRNHQILIPASVNGGPQLWCLLDTGGAGLVYLGPKRAAELGIEPTFASRTSGALDPAFHASPCALVTLDVGSVHLASQELVIKEGGPNDGTIGAKVFADSIIELDYQTAAVRFHPRASFHYRGPGDSISFYLWSDNPNVVGYLTIDGSGPVEARMTVDTGAGACAAYVTPKFNDELHRLGRSLPWMPGGNGISTCHIDRVAVGRSTMDSPVIGLIPAQGFGGDTGAPDAILGVEFLRRYRIFLDYTKKEMILEPGLTG